MKMLVIQLVFAAAVLIGSVNLHPSHKRTIIDIINKYNNTLNKELYVENVEHLFNNNNRCSNAFFCKAHEILVKHSNATGNEQDLMLKRNLKQIIGEEKCEKTVKSKEKILFTKFLDDLKSCIQCRNTKPREPSC